MDSTTIKDQLIKTKLFLPEIKSSSVNRSRLYEILDDFINFKLSLVVAPAGFGKTTLVSGWANSYSGKKTWLSLDNNDNDISRFLSYFVAALQKIDSNIGTSVIKELNEKSVTNIEWILNSLINELSAQLEDFIIVLDDFHFITDERIINAMAYLLKHSPRQIRYIVITRDVNNLSLSKLRSKNQLLEITEDDLRFTEEEVNLFLNDVLNLKISSEDITTLFERTEGWVTGLQLVSLSIKSQKNKTEFLKSFSGTNKYIAEYLVEEVIDKQPIEIQKFLLKTSILSGLCGSLCDAVVPESLINGQELLEYLKHINLFIVPLDNDDNWYRYHHLFGELLLQKLYKKEQINEIEKLHLLASNWYLKNGFTDLAVEHAIKSMDFELVASIIEFEWSNMDKNLQSNKWLNWAKQLPVSIQNSHPIISVGYAWALLDLGILEGVDEKLRIAEEYLSNGTLNNISSDLKDNDLEKVMSLYKLLPTIILTARAYYYALIGDIDSSLENAMKAKQLTKNGESYNKDVANALIGLVQFTNGNLVDAYDTINDKSNDEELQVMVSLILGKIKIEQGDLFQASKIFEKALQYSKKSGGKCLPLIPSFYLGLGNIKLLKGDLSGAQLYLEKSEEASKVGILQTWKYNWYLFDGLIKEYSRSFNEALKSFECSSEHYFSSPDPDVMSIDALKVRVLLKQGKLYEALDWAKSNHFDIEDEISYLNEYNYISFVRIMISQYKKTGKKKDLRDAKYLVEKLILEVEHSMRKGRLIELKILCSIIYDICDNNDAAIKKMQEAIAIAESEHLIVSFILEGNQIYKLLNNTEIIGKSPIFVTGILKKIDEGFKKNNQKSSHQINIDSLTYLSKREFEILRLISEGYSNQDISKKLFLAISTVKNYNQNLYSKLQVKSRTEAISRAKEMGIL